MPKYHILVNEQQAVTYEVEAESEDQARDIFAGCADGKVKQIERRDMDWTLCDIEEIKEENANV